MFTGIFLFMTQYMYNNSKDNIITVNIKQHNVILKIDNIKVIIYYNFTTQLDLQVGYLLLYLQMIHH